MWWQSKEFSTDREADRTHRAERGGTAALVVVAAVLLWLVLGWLGVVDNGLTPIPPG